MGCGKRRNGRRNLRASGALHFALKRALTCGILQIVCPLQYPSQVDSIQQGLRRPSCLQRRKAEDARVFPPQDQGRSQEISHPEDVPKSHNKNQLWEIMFST
jgi:hypothetical protein